MHFHYRHLLTLIIILPPHTFHLVEHRWCCLLLSIGPPAVSNALHCQLHFLGGRPELKTEHWTNCHSHSQDYILYLFTSLLTTSDVLSSGWPPAGCCRCPRPRWRRWPRSPTSTSPPTSWAACRGPSAAPRSCGHSTWPATPSHTSTPAYSAYPCPTSEHRENFKVLECSLFWSWVSPGFLNQNVAIETFTLPQFIFDLCEFLVWRRRPQWQCTVHFGVGDGSLYPCNFICLVLSSFMDGRLGESIKYY